MVKIRRHSSSVNYPPTPELWGDQVQGKEPTLQEIINITLIESGEKEQLMELLRERLIECRWKQEMRHLCSNLIKRQDEGFEPMIMKARKLKDLWGMDSGKTGLERRGRNKTKDHAGCAHERERRLAKVQGTIKLNEI